VDRWSCDNHHSVVLARSGAGKSYLVKLETLRSLYDGGIGPQVMAALRNAAIGALRLDGTPTSPDRRAHQTVAA
jgi:hypothetical protein